MESSLNEVQFFHEFIGLIGGVIPIIAIAISGFIATLTLISFWNNVSDKASELITFFPIHISGDVEKEWNNDTPTIVPDDANMTTCLEAASSRHFSTNALKEVLTQNKRHQLSSVGFIIAGLAIMVLFIASLIFLGFSIYIADNGLFTYEVAVFNTLVVFSSLIISFIFVGYVLFFLVVKVSNNNLTKIIKKYGSCECSQNGNYLVVKDVVIK